MPAASFGQKMSKDEEKKWSKIAKNYSKNPEALKKLTEEHKQFSRNLTQLENEIETLKQSIDEKNSRLEAAQNESSQLRTRLANAESNMNSLSSRQEQDQEKETSNNSEFGIWFKVQIGAYNERKIADNLKSDNLSLEGDDTQKIVIGSYRNYEDAKQLKDQLQAMGVKGAWVVSYKNGERISIDEALNN